MCCSIPKLFLSFSFSIISFHILAFCFVLTNRMSVIWRKGKPVGAVTFTMFKPGRWDYGSSHGPVSLSMLKIADNIVFLPGPVGASFRVLSRWLSNRLSKVSGITSWIQAKMQDPIFSFITQIKSWIIFLSSTPPKSFTTFVYVLGFDTKKDCPIVTTHLGREQNNG